MNIKGMDREFRKLFGEPQSKLDKAKKVVDVLCYEDQLELLKYLKKKIRGKEYLLLNVKYSDRINTDYHLEEMINAMWTIDEEFQILFVGGHLGEEPRFDCVAKDDEDCTKGFKEHPNARKIYNLKGDRYWDGILFQGERGLYTALMLLETVKKFEHCACLDAPYKIETINLVDKYGENFTVIKLQFDTESG